MHLVDKHIFDIQYDSESTALEMQRKISSISNAKLFDVIDGIFDEFETSETVRIDTLQLHLGKIREANLEEDLLEAVSIALRKELQTQLERSDQSTTIHSSANTAARNSLQIFEQFVLSGTIPWWIRNRNDFNIRKTIDTLLESNVSEIVEIIRKRAHKPYFLERLVMNLSDQQLSRLIERLAPTEAKLILEAAQNIQKVQERKPIVQAQQRTYRNKVWEFVLTYLLIDRGTYFNQKMFVQSTLTRLAHHFNVEYSEFLKHFYNAVKELNKERIAPRNLVEIIKEIYADGDLTHAVAKKNGTLSALEITAAYTQLLDSSPNFDSTFEKQLLQLIRSKSEVFLSFVHREAHNRQLHSNLALALSDGVMHQFVGFIEPQSKDVIVQFSRNVRRLKESGRIAISGSSQEFRNSTWEFIIRALLVDRGSQFNLKSFVKSALSEIAAHYNIVLHDLMHYVLLDLSVHQSIDKSALESVLHEIKQEEEQRYLENDSKEKVVFEQRIKFQWLEYALTHSEFPTWSKRHHLTATNFQELLFFFIQKDRSSIQNLLRLHLRDNRKRHFLIQQLDAQSRHRLVRFLNKQAADKIALYDKLLDKIQERRSVAVNKHEFESIKWSTILEIITEEKGSFFNYKSFLLRSLYALSNRLNISFEVLFSYVLEISSTLPNMPESPLQNALLSIQKDLSSSSEEGILPDFNLSKEIKVVWKKMPNDAPIEAQYLLGILQKMQTDMLFRSQFDLHSWLRKHPTITKDVFRHLLNALEWNPGYFANMLGGQSNNSMQQFLQWLVGNEYPFIAYYLKDLNTILAYTSLNRSLLIRQSELFSVAYLSKHSRFDKHQYFFALLQFLSQFVGRKPQNLLQEIHEIIKTEAPKLNSTLPLSVSKAAHGEELEDSMEEEVLVEDVLKNEVLEEIQEEKPDLDGVYIENAGIVIMWPFLRQLFEILELTQENSFVSIAASIRGVQLLQYACTGETSHPEHELILNKLLCGIPVSIPIDATFELSPKEREIADGMVQGILHNWPGMQETSVEALRETFLIRAGKISFEEETNDMHVEKKSVDVLMDRLPWSFTFVNLPWMKKPLRTIWK